MDFKEQAKRFAESLQQKGAEATSEIVDVSRKGIRSGVELLLVEHSKFEPILEQAGFIVGDIQIRLSIPPALIVSIEQAQDNAFVRLQDLSNEQTLTKMQKTVISLIREAYKLDDLVTSHKHKISQFELEYSIPPGVTIHLHSEKSRVFGTTKDNGTPENVTKTGDNE